MRIKYLILSAFLFCVFLLNAEIKVASVLGDNMVLQRNSEVNLWGKGSPYEKLSIITSWNHAKTNAVCNPKGEWLVKVKTTGAGGPYTIMIATAKENIILKNILLGEVWVCAGQSNMEFSMAPDFPWTRGVVNYKHEINDARFSDIRLFHIERNAASFAQSDCNGHWTECTPSDIKNFSAVAYYFGRKLHQSLKVPIGLIEAAFGGSPCEAWTRYDVLSKDTTLKRVFIHSSIHLLSDTTHLKDPQNYPGSLFNGMVSPMVGFGIKGVIWYQGENNVSTAWIYAKLWGAMIKDWRKLWGIGEFPVYYVQLPAYHDPRWVALREAQDNALSVPNTGMAVSIDVGEADQIHPLNKEPVGNRLAIWALAKTYGQRIIYSGPAFKSSKILGNKVIISFHKATIGRGLASKDGLILKGFEIAGANKFFYPAKAVIVGDNIEVSSSDVPVPTIVQYAYESVPCANLVNKEGLPAIPFRTDKWNHDITVFDK